MEKLSLKNFTVDSHISAGLSATAGKVIDVKLGDELSGQVISLSPGSTPLFCRWDCGERWGHVYSSGRITEFNGEHHISL